MNAKETSEYIIKRFGVRADRTPTTISCTRECLPALFKDLGYKIGAEIGVRKGYFSESLCVGNPQGWLYSIDPWVVHDSYKEYSQQKELDRVYHKAINRLSKYSNCKIVRKFSIDAAADFHNESLDYVYIDANHDYQPALDDLKSWVPKVRVGGIVSGHDYGRDDDSGIRVKEAVDEYVRTHGVSGLFVTSERSSSFLWVKD